MCSQLLTFHVSSQREEVRIKLALPPCSQDVPSFLCNFMCERKTSCSGSYPGLPSTICRASTVAMGRCLGKSDSKPRTSYFPQVLSQNDYLQHRGFPDTAVICLLGCPRWSSVFLMFVQSFLHPQWTFYIPSILQQGFLGSSAAQEEPPPPPPTWRWLPKASPGGSESCTGRWAAAAFLVSSTDSGFVALCHPLPSCFFLTYLQVPTKGRGR